MRFQKSHIHLVSNKTKKIDAMENKKNIFIVGSPDVDVILGKICLIYLKSRKDTKLNMIILQLQFTPNNTNIKIYKRVSNFL